MKRRECGIVMNIILLLAALSLLCASVRLFCGEQQGRAVMTAAGSAEDSGLYCGETPGQIQQSIARNIIRLHVIANSDAEDDQRLKLLVRDKIITSLQEAMRSAGSVDEAGRIIAAEKMKIEEMANGLLAELGSPYTARVALGRRYFPVKQYGDLTFPPGVYQALCVEIGRAEGRNWWCVLFPSLCFVDETTASVPDDSKEKLRDHLTEGEYQYISGDDGNEDNAESPGSAAGEEGGASEDSGRPELHFGIWEMFFKRE